MSFIRKWFQKCNAVGLTPMESMMLASGVMLALKEPPELSAQIGKKLRQYLLDKGYSEQQIQAITKEDITYMLESDVDHILPKSYHGTSKEGWENILKAGLKNPGR